MHWARGNGICFTTTCSHQSKKFPRFSSSYVLDSASGRSEYHTRLALEGLACTTAGYDITVNTATNMPSGSTRLSSVGTWITELISQLMPLIDFTALPCSTGQNLPVEDIAKMLKALLAQHAPTFWMTYRRKFMKYVLFCMGRACKPILIQQYTVHAYSLFLKR